MGQMHERRRKIIGRSGIEGHSRPITAGERPFAGNIAPVFILELGGLYSRPWRKNMNTAHTIMPDGGNRYHHNEEKRTADGRHSPSCSQAGLHPRVSESVSTCLYACWPAEAWKRSSIPQEYRNWISA